MFCNSSFIALQTLQHKASLLKTPSYGRYIRLIYGRIFTPDRVVDVRYVTVTGTTPWTTDEHAVGGVETPRREGRHGVPRQ